MTSRSRTRSDSDVVDACRCSIRHTETERQREREGEMSCSVRACATSMDLLKQKCYRRAVVLCSFVGDIQGGPKKVSLRCLHITSSNTGRFSKFFHCHILQEICNIAIIKYPTSPQTCCYTTLWNIYVIKIACSARCGNLAKTWTLQNPDSWKPAAAILNKMYWLLLLSLSSCINF